MLQLESLWTSSDSPWSDSRLVPVYVALLSVVLNAGQLARQIVSARRQRSLQPLFSTTGADVAKLNDSIFNPHETSIRLLTATRALLCGFLAVASLIELIRGPTSTSGFVLLRLSNLALIHLAECLFFLYATVLCSVAVTKKSSAASFHVNLLLLVSLVVYVYRDVYPLCTYTLSPLDSPERGLLWAKIIVLTLVAVIIPLITPLRYNPLDPENPLPPSEEQTAAPLAFITFSFLDRIIVDAWKHPHLPYDHLPNLCDYDQAAVLREKGAKYLLVPPGGKRRHLAVRIFLLYWRQNVFLMLSLLVRALVNLLAPFALNRLLAFIEVGGVGAFVKPWVWIIAMFLSPFLSAVMFQTYVFVSGRSVVQLEAIFTQLIYERALRTRISSTTSSTKSSADAKVDAQTQHFAGRLHNLISADTDEIIAARDPLLQLIIFTPFKGALCLYFLYKLLGPSAFVGAFILLAGLWVPGKINQRMHSVQVKLSKATDARVQSVTQTLGVARLIKMFAYEREAEDEISQKREVEVGWMKKKYYLTIAGALFNWTLPLLALIATFFTFTVILKKPLSASTVFSSLTVFDSFRQELWRLNWSIPQIIAGKVSLDRMDAFLLDSDVIEDIELSSNTTAQVGFRDVTLTWNRRTESSPNDFALKVPGEVLFKTGALNVVTGPTGSGKTALLLALLGELHCDYANTKSFVSLPRTGGVAYAAQSPWILNKSVKENIVFGAEFDAERYRAVLKACALERDLELFDAGDDTEIGEKGITLSGGQKSRLSLARAVYANANVILLDDVLSALDAHTARSVLQDCLAGPLLRSRTVILVTHQLALAAPLAQRFVEVTSDGTVRVTVAPPAELLKAELSSVDATMAAQDEKASEALASGKLPTEDGKKPVKDGKIIKAESTAVGRVATQALKLLFSGMGGVPYWVVLLTLTIGNEVAGVLLSWWLGVWARQYEFKRPADVSVRFYLGLYAALVVVGTIVFCGGYLLYTRGVLRARKIIHTKLVVSILAATLRFLDTTPSGRIIARFTQDIRTVDNSLAGSLRVFMTRTSTLLVQLSTIVILTPIYLLPGIALASITYTLGRIYMAAQLSVKREKSNTRSPVFGHFDASMHGITSIRAYGVQSQFQDQSLGLIDHYTRPARAFWNLNRWIGIRVDTLGGIFCAGLAAYLLYVQKETNASRAGLQLNLAIGFSETLLWWVRNLNEIEVSANSLERIQEYLDIDHEPPSSSSLKAPAAWPTSGSLDISNLTAQYTDDGAEVLHDLSFSIRSGEKVGVVGRTGSGKSTLSLSLLRLIPTNGMIVYDGLDVKKMNLEDLRRAVTIIPQSPELLSGTIRQNLDPFGSHSDATLNDALRSVGFFLVRDREEVDATSEGAGGTLDSVVQNGGTNLSMGQRQLVALARALVRRTKLIILDEATASLDHATDALVQDALRSPEFAETTIITIAHRLQTVMDYDKIMLLDAGNLIEFDAPSALLAQSHDGGKVSLKALVDNSADREALYRKAGVAR